MSFLKTTWFLPCALIILSCSRETKSIYSQQETITADNENTRSQMGRLSLSSTRGHVVASWEHKLDENITFVSIQQPEASYQTLNDKQLVLSELKPQHHDILISRKKDGALAFAFFKELLIEAGKYVELGLPPFHSPGSIFGRVFSTKIDAPVANAIVRIKELNLATQTNDQGLFSFEELPVGTWNIAVHTPELGILSNTELTVKPKTRTNLGDLWLGAGFTNVHAPVLLNGENGIVSEPKAKIKIDAPNGARFVTVSTQEGETLISRDPMQRIITVPFSKPMTTTLLIRILNDKEKTMGTQTLTVEFDPFAVDGKKFEPIVEVQSRVLNSPNRTYQFIFKNTPANASRIKISHNGNDGNTENWQSPQTTLNYTLPKSNLSCGQHLIDIELENEAGFRSKKLKIPLTLSCWNRMPHRPTIEKVIGIDNAAVWTGTHAFVWSGKQLDVSRRSSIWGGSNSAETVMHQETLQTYSYLDSGYIFKPNFDSSSQIARPSLEPIITDWAPMPRTGAGIAGLNNYVAVYGGENGNEPIADGAVFNIEANGWVSMMNDGAPSARIKPSVFFVSEHEILVWGGYTRTDLGYELPLNDGAVYNTKTHRWRKISSENAPGARMNHVGVWTGTDFFVFGGVLPGNIEQLKNYKYNLEADTWTLLKQNTYDAGTDTWNAPESNSVSLTHMSAVHVGDLIIFYGRDQLCYIYGISGDKQLLSGRVTTPDPNDSSLSIPIPNLNFNPAMVVTDHPQSSDKKVVSIFGGSASSIDSDISENFLVMVVNASGTKPAEMIDFILTSIDIKDIFPPATAGLYKPKANCCVDFLAFNANNYIFAINGTEVSNTSIYTDIKRFENADTSANNLSSTLYSYKGHNSKALRYSDDLNSITPYSLDRPKDKVDLAPLGPYSLYSTSRPVVDPAKNRLIFYGGMYGDPYVIKYQQGGFIYDVTSKSWQNIPVSPSEPKLSNGQSISRFDTINFISNGIFHMLGGWQYISGAETHLLTGLKSNLNPNEDQTPSSFTPTSLNPGESFDYMMNAKSIYDSIQPNQFCQIGEKVLITGGVRKVSTSQTAEPALLQDKVVVDSSNQRISKPTTDPLNARAAPTVIATDEGCFLWGGYTAENATFTNNNLTVTLESIRSQFTPKGDGAIYMFSSDSWIPVSNINAPSPRAFMHGLWNGSQVILWGGRTNTTPSTASNYDEMKGVWSYSPASNTWTAHTPQHNEPSFHGDEQPVWTGRHMFIFKPWLEEYSYQFTLSENSWKKLPMPAGFNFGPFAYWGVNTAWVNGKLFVMPYFDKSPALMGLFVPPDP